MSGFFGWLIDFVTSPLSLGQHPEHEAPHIEWAIVIVVIKCVLMWKRHGEGDPRWDR